MPDSSTAPVICVIPQAEFSHGLDSASITGVRMRGR